MRRAVPVVARRHVVPGRLETDVVVVVTGLDVDDAGHRRVHRVGLILDETGAVRVVDVSGVDDGVDADAE